MSYKIRQETVADREVIYKLVETAFKTAKVSDGDEQNFTMRLWNGENHIPQLGLVAEEDGKLIGHIMFTHTYVTNPDGSRFNTLLVAPLSVLLEYRSQGVGSALVQEGIKIAKAMGYDSAFLCGDPDYYKKFGYRPTHLYGISHENIPSEYVMAIELTENSLNGVTGVINM